MIACSTLKMFHGFAKMCGEIHKAHMEKLILANLVQ